MKKADKLFQKFISEGQRATKKWKTLAGIMAIIVTFSVTYSLIMPAITVSRDEADDIAGLFLDDSEEAFDIVEDDGDEDEMWTSEGDVIQHTGVLEDDWDGILIEEETEDETEDKTEETGSGIIQEEPAQSAYSNAHYMDDIEDSTETELEAAPEEELETAAETDPDIDIMTLSEMYSEVEAETEPETETESETEAETESETEVETESETEIQTESETEIETETESATRFVFCQ